jgi:hypothetical protein
VAGDVDITSRAATAPTGLPSSQRQQQYYAVRDWITVIGNGDNHIDGGKGPDWIFISGGAVTTIPDGPRLVRSDLWTSKAGRDGKPNGAKP